MVHSIGVFVVFTRVFVDEGHVAAVYDASRVLNHIENLFSSVVLLVELEPAQSVLRVALPPL